MNHFQIRCEQRLKEALKTKGFFVQDRLVPGGVTYIRGRVEDYQFWIYDDGADFSSDFYGKTYEKYSYENLDHLIMCFVSDFVDAVENIETYKKEHGEKIKKWPYRLFRIFRRK